MWVDFCCVASLVTTMSNDFISELRSILKFFQSLWGLLGGISIFFPLSGTLFGLMPLQTRQFSLPVNYIRNASVREVNENLFVKSPYGTSFVSPRFITTVATIVTIFVVFQTIASRESFRTSSRTRNKLIAYRDFAIALTLLFLYLVVYFQAIDLILDLSVFTN